MLFSLTKSKICNNSYGHYFLNWSYMSSGDLVKNADSNSVGLGCFKDMYGILGSLNAIEAEARSIAELVEGKEVASIRCQVLKEMLPHFLRG